jgi:hypothetical protein
METELKVDEKKGVAWKIPKSLYEKLQIKADKDRRSVTQTAIIMLEKSLKDEQ